MHREYGLDTSPFRLDNTGYLDPGETVQDCHFNIAQNQVSYHDFQHSSLLCTDSGYRSDGMRQLHGIYATMSTITGLMTVMMFVLFKRGLSFDLASVVTYKSTLALELLDTAAFRSSNGVYPTDSSHNGVHSDWLTKYKKAYMLVSYLIFPLRQRTSEQDVMEPAWSTGVLDWQRVLQILYPDLSFEQVRQLSKFDRGLSCRTTDCCGRLC